MVLTAHKGQSLAGVAPLQFHEDQSKLSFIGAGISDYLDLICETDSAGLAAACFIEHLWSSPVPWSHCEFQELRRESPLLLTASPFSGQWVCSPLGVCPAINLPDTITEYLQSVDSKLRRTIKQARKKMPGYSLEKATAAEVPGFMDALYFLHRKRWAGRNLPGVLDAPEVQAFHHEAAAAFSERGTLGLYGLRYQGTLAAVLYGFEKWPGFYAYISGFDPEPEDLSPGALLISLVIEDCIGRKFRRFDFLRGGEKYKYLWGAKDSLNHRLTITR